VSEPRVKTGSLTLSWLVRCWEEPREQVKDETKEEPVLRCFIRDLKTGEERYLRDPRELVELVVKPMSEAGKDDGPEQKQDRTRG
jgi:hypothetical protein